MIRHEHISTFGIQQVESDRLHPNPGETHPGPGRPHSHAIEEADVPGKESPGKAQECGHGKGQAPEGEHQDGANHGRASPDIWDSPLSQAARRAFCCTVTLSTSARSNSTCSRLASFQCSSCSPSELRTRRCIFSPG